MSIRRRRLAGDRGGISVATIVLIPVMFLSVALVIDGGRQLESRREARGAAAAAARAGVNLSNAEAVAGALHIGLARQRAFDSLAADGIAGSVTVTGVSVSVETSRTVDYILLPDVTEVAGRATAEVFVGITEGTP